MAIAGSRWRWRAAVVGAAACLALAVVGPAGAAARKRPTPDPAFQGNGGSRQAAGVAELGDGWIAVGQETDDDNDSHAAIWLASKVHATEGTWSRVDDSAISGDFDNQLGADSQGLTIDSTAHAVIVGSNGIGIAGSVTYHQASGGNDAVNGPQPAAWFSNDDGASFASKILPLPDGAKVGIVSSIAWRNGRFVGVGTVSPDDHIGGEGDRPEAWFSDDGVTWSTAVGMLGSVSDEAKAESVTAASSGASPQFVAVGSAVANKDEDAAVWTSDDGTQWSKVADSAALGKHNKVRDQEMHGVAAIYAGGADAGFMAAGDESQNPNSTSNGVVWFSKDGTDWSRSSASSSTFSSNDKRHPSTLLTAVTVGAGYYLVAGYTQNDKTGSTRARLWESSHGKKWAPLQAEDRSDQVESAMLGADTNDKSFEVVGVLYDDANNWNGSG